MSDTLKAALIALVGTAILGPIVVRGLTWLSEKRSQLLVVLTWHAVGKSKKLEEQVTNHIMKSDAFRAATIGDESKWNEIRLFRSFFSAQSYMNFKILNNSRKKLAYLTMFDNQSSDLYKIDDGEVLAVERGQPIILGDLQPGREVELHLWSSWSVPVWNPRATERFKFSADELDRVVIKEPMHEFLKKRYIYQALKYFSICMYAISIGIAVLAYFNGGALHFLFKVE